MLFHCSTQGHWKITLDQLKNNNFFYSSLKTLGTLPPATPKSMAAGRDTNSLSHRAPPAPKPKVPTAGAPQEALTHIKALGSCETELCLIPHQGLRCQSPQGTPQPENIKISPLPWEILHTRLNLRKILAK